MGCPLSKLNTNCSKNKNETSNHITNIFGTLYITLKTKKKPNFRYIYIVQQDTQCSLNG